MLLANSCCIKSMVCLNDDVYIGTKGGAILVMGITKMVVHGVLHLQDSPINCLFFMKQYNTHKVTIKKFKTTSVNSSCYAPKDNILLVNFALDYHGFSQYSGSRPPSYNYPQMTSLGHYQQPVAAPDKDDLYMLMWLIYS